LPFDVIAARRASRFRGVLLGLSIVCGVWSAAAAEPPVASYQIKHTFPHDPHAFTEGLFYLNGFLFESTGQPGQSTIRRVRLKDGVVLQSVSIDPKLFGEGIVNWGDQIISLTWRDQVGFRWNLHGFAKLGEFHYRGEGWALTQNGKTLILSDGTPVLHFLDPVSLRQVRQIQVTADGQPVNNLNELEWVKGEILANVWMTNRIARIDPSTGVVKGWIDLSALPEALSETDPDAVLNGIAYDREHDRLFVTGKYWPHVYEIKLTPAKGAR
jgi:glutaminyl-peptide cyclotransferase